MMHLLFSIIAVASVTGKVDEFLLSSIIVVALITVKGYDFVALSHSTKKMVMIILVPASVTGKSDDVAFYHTSSLCQRL